MMLVCPFRALAAAPTEHLLEVQSGNARPVIAEVRHLLTSSDPNGIYVFVCCLSSIDPKLWAGTTPDIPAVLEGWEVERVMKLLENEDSIIRKQVSVTISGHCYTTDSVLSYHRQYGHYGVSTKA